ncbi:hypothetical protein [Mesorhizobium sp. M1307]
MPSPPIEPAWSDAARGVDALTAFEMGQKKLRRAVDGGSWFDSRG